MSKNHFRISSEIFDIYRLNQRKNLYINELPQPPKSEASFGDFWLTDYNYKSITQESKSVTETHLVVILSVDNSFPDIPNVIVGVVSDRIKYATIRDFVLPKGIAPQGSSSEMIELWNSFRISVDGLRKYVGKIEEKELLEKLRTKYEDDKSNPDYNLQLTSIFENVFIPEDLPHGMISFARSKEYGIDEEMISFWETEWKNTEYLREQQFTLEQRISETKRKAFNSIEIPKSIISRLQQHDEIIIPMKRYILDEDSAYAIAEPFFLEERTENCIRSVDQEIKLFNQNLEWGLESRLRIHDSIELKFMGQKYTEIIRIRIESTDKTIDKIFAKHEIVFCSDFCYVKLLDDDLKLLSMRSCIITIFLSDETCYRVDLGNITSDQEKKVHKPDHK